MPDDKYSKENIKDGCDKAEFLDRINQYLPKCRRALVIFDTPGEIPHTTDFHYAQVGFIQTYELSGFLDMVKDIVWDNDGEDDADNP